MTDNQKERKRTKDKLIKRENQRGRERERTKGENQKELIDNNYIFEIF